MNVARKRHLDHGSGPETPGHTGSERLTVHYTQTCSNRVDTRADLREQDPDGCSDRVLTGVNPARFRHFDHGPETPIPLVQALAPYAAKTAARRTANWSRVGNGRNESAHTIDPSPANRTDEEVDR